ncbi:hypothetical protein [Acidovorax sp.]|uniref:hypothetical protein n=1 Tax=Acidovorax sp. TaxID=1872122 RepID=UPI003D027375
MTFREDYADQTWTYEEVSKRAMGIRDFFAAARVSVHRDSTLGVLLGEAEALAREWENGRDTGGIARLVAASNMNRIADAIDSIQEDLNALEHLKRIARNDVDLWKRKLSQGKDALWELELLGKLKRNGAQASILEPDIVVELGSERYAIACKKIYSERGVEAQVRKGVNQIKAAGLPGIVALNLDEMVPAGTLLQAGSLAEAKDFMHAFNVDFITRNRHRIERFMSSGRCKAILCSTSVPSGIETAKPRFNNHTQQTFWTLEKVSTAKGGKLLDLGRLLGASI